MVMLTKKKIIIITLSNGILIIYRDISAQVYKFVMIELLMRQKK
jgi:hypothetical protein